MASTEWYGYIKTLAGIYPGQLMSDRANIRGILPKLVRKAMDTMDSRRSEFLK